MIVGGGPAGLSAAVYMGRFRRRTLVVDSGLGRWTYGQTNENYLGFPNGVNARKLHDLGVRQAARFGVAFRDGEVTRVRQASGGLALDMPDGELLASTVIWAAGVRDRWPTFPGARRLVGKQLFWCIVCDGWRCLERRVLLLGNDDKAAGTVLQFLTYSRDLTMLVDPASNALSPTVERKLRRRGIEVKRGVVRRVNLAEDGVCGVSLRDGSSLDVDLVFSLYGSDPNTAPLSELGVNLASNGHVRINEKNQTNLECFFAAGDVSNKHGHQVATAVHEGAQAAQAANHVLYPEALRLPKLPREG